MKKLLLVSLCAMMLVFNAVSHLQAATVVNLMVNGDFDAGPGSPWNEYSSGGWDLIDAWTYPLPSPHSGNYYAWLGGATDLTDGIYQDVEIPTATIALTMSFYTWIQTEEPGGGAYDFLNIYINSLPLLKLDNTDSDWIDGWTMFIFNISGDYAGDTVRICFESSNDYSYFTSFYIDTIALNATVPIPSTLLLLGSGLIGVLGFRRKFRKR